MLNFWKKPQQWQVITILGLGVFALSTAAIFIRLAMEEAGMQGVGFSLFVAASRLLLASLILSPVLPRVNLKCSSKAFAYAVGAGLFLAAHFATWITSLSFTSIAASTTIVTTTPLWVAIFAWLGFGENLSKKTWVGVVISLVGGGLIALGGAEGNAFGSNPLLGDGLALLGAWCVSLYLLLGREAQRSGLGVGGYVAIAYTVGALVLLPFPLLFGVSYFGYSSTVYLYLFALALLSQVFGHTTLNWAISWVSPTFVTLGVLFEPIGSCLLGILLFGEVPGVLVLVGAGVLLTGVAIAIFNR